ncbi:MAG TPA: putative Ig domain-containing protein [Bryobacteraceae bacterium]|nr:putative Ig domain-containing protein [Bryobacteraceae bacterium]
MITRIAGALVVCLGLLSAAQPPILTPKPSPKPRINGARIFGVRPGRPFLHTIAATGQRPMTFSAKGLPAGLTLDQKSGRISGFLSKPGEHVVTLRAANSLGAAERRFRIVVGDKIALTPPMGWNSWYAWSESVSDEKIRSVARGFVAKGLVNHGWTYVNIDDCWQGLRGGKYNAIQGNERFRDIKGMCDYVHGLGLKIGIYSTPWMATYGGFIGGSAPTAKGDYSGMWLPPEKRLQPYQVFGRWPSSQRLGAQKLGAYWFSDADAKQWAEWGIDYVKHDWKPNDPPTTERILKGLLACGRDIVLSLSNEAPFEHAAEWARLSNLWRTTGDIKATWEAVSRIGFTQDRWAPYAGPGHWNDPDMLQIGMIGVPNTYVRTLKPTVLTPGEQYTQVSLWSLLAAPLLLSCDIETMDDFTLSLVTNDEVIDVNQDPLGKSGVPVSRAGGLEVWAKQMEDGSQAVGLFNRSDQEATVTARWSDLGVRGKQEVRDLWRQKDLGVFEGQFQTKVAGHGVVLVRVSAR